MLELHSNGYQQQVTITPDQLGLSPRDISIFVESKLGKTSERASIVPRNGAILFRTEIVRSIVRADRLWLFKCRCAADFHLPSDSGQPSEIDESRLDLISP